MTTPGERLGQVQYQGHLAIDRVYRDLAPQMHQAVLAQSRPDAGGVHRLLPGIAQMTVLNAIRRTLSDAAPHMATAALSALNGAVQAAKFDQTPLPIIQETVLLFTGWQQVQRTVQSSQQNVVEQAGALLLKGAVRGLPATLIAHAVRNYFSPFFSPIRDAKGKLLRRERQGTTIPGPGNPGMASYPLRLVMLNETGLIHAEYSRLIAIRDDGFLRYHVSHKHLKTDECDILERRDVGYGPGVYPARDAPRVPRHPNCRCWYEVAARERFLARSESVP